MAAAQAASTAFTESSAGPESVAEAEEAAAAGVSDLGPQATMSPRPRRGARRMRQLRSRGVKTRDPALSQATVSVPVRHPLAGFPCGSAGAREEWVRIGERQLRLGERHCRTPAPVRG